MQQAQALLGDVPNVTLRDIPTNDAWMPRPWADVFGRPAGQPPALIDWRYNAWGGKYPPFDPTTPCRSTSAAR